MYKELNNKTDEEIAKIVQLGEIEPFGVLVKRYEKKIMRYAKRFLFGYDDAEDLVQDVFIKAFVNIKSFDIDRRFSPWIYRIAHNEFINMIKKKGKESVSFFNPDVLFPHLVSEETPEKEVNETELREALDNCLKSLSPKYREVVVLHYYEELSYREISDVLRVPISTVGIRLKRGREKMKLLCKNLI